MNKINSENRKFFTNDGNDALRYRSNVANYMNNLIYQEIFKSLHKDIPVIGNDTPIPDIDVPENEYIVITENWWLDY